MIRKILSMLLPVIRRSVQPCKQGNSRRSMSNRDAATIVQGGIRGIPRAGDVLTQIIKSGEDRDHLWWWLQGRWRSGCDQALNRFAE
ncbi:hypothetical protein [Mesorhizobium qingshengii]|uniref:hypothetical protein n=1 Tax=Mesorhizobium qingshengii TaxID=1165689 RepID=UPI001428A6AE|nr:hypothetical protein [Mesorhizobium qingshengii]